MIEKIRQYSETWWFKTFLGLMALVFVLLWGGGDLLNQMGGNRQTIATVGDTNLTSWDFERTVNRELALLSRQRGAPISPQEAYSAGLYHSTLLKMIDETLVMLEADRLGLSVSDRAVRAAIVENPLFQSQEGGFNKQNFLSLLSRLGYTEAGFVEEMRREMVRNRLFGALFQGTTFPPLQAKFLYEWQEQTRQLAYVVVEGDQIKIRETPTAEQLTAFFKDKEAALKSPEFRDVTALVIDAEHLAPTLTVTAEELQKAYTDRAAEFEGKSLSDAKPTLEKDLQQAKALEKAYSLSTQVEDIIAGGATLAEAAAQLSLPLQDLMRIDRQGRPDVFKTKDGKVSPPTELEQAIAAEAFTLDPQVIGSALEVKNGLFFVAQVSQVYPAAPRTQADVHPDYAKILWQRFRQQEELLKRVESLKESATSRGQLAIAANKNKVRLQSVRVSRKGAALPSSLVLTPRLLTDVFAAQKEGVVVGLLERPAESPAFIVGLVEAIHYPAVEMAGEDFKTFLSGLSDMQRDDFSREYINALRKRFTVNINQRFMDGLKQSLKPEK